MRILLFFIPHLLAEIPECNESQKRICERRKGFKCFGMWDYWGKGKFQCRKTVKFLKIINFKIFKCINNNCGICSELGTEYKYSGKMRDKTDL